MSDGYTTFFNGTAHADAATDSVTPAYGQATVTSLDGQPLANPVQVYTFAAMIDPTRGITLRDESIAGGGGLAAEITVDPAVNPTDVFDGWVPAYGSGPPPAPEITVQVPASRANHEWALFSDPARQPASYPWPNPEPHYGWPSPLPASERVVYAGVDGMADYAVDFHTFVLPNSTPYFGGPFLLQDMATLEPHDVSAGPNDLRQWFTAEQAVNLEISTSRFGHQLRVRHPNGGFFAITQLPPAVNGSLGPNRTILEVPYYFFNATASARTEMPWYVEDVDADERIGPGAGQSYPNNDDLIRWIYVTPPSGLTAHADPLGIHLAWVPGEVTNGGGFIIERRESLQTDGPFTAWHELHRLPASQTSWLDTHLAPGQYAIYRVRAFFGNGTDEHRSPPSNRKRAAMWQRNDNGDWETPGGDNGTGGGTVTDPPGGGDGSWDGGNGNGNGNSGDGNGNENWDGGYVIPGDGDGDGDPDNDKDGVVDTADSYPGDPKRSEDIPVKFYGVIDLTSGINVPLLPLRNVGPVIDDENHVAWAGYSSTGSLRSIVWADGATTSIDSGPLTATRHAQGENWLVKIQPWYFGGTNIGPNGTNSAIASDGTVFGHFWCEFAPIVDGQVTDGDGFQGNFTFDAGGLNLSPGWSIPKPESSDIKYIMVGAGGTPFFDAVSKNPAPAFPTHTAKVGTAVLAGPLSETSTTLYAFQPGAISSDASQLIWGKNQLTQGTDTLTKYYSTATPGGAGYTNLPLAWGFPLWNCYAINNEGQAVGSQKYWVTDSSPRGWHYEGYEDPDDEFPDGNEKPRPGRGELGFLWSPTDGLKVFHDLLPEKFRKQLRSAVPFLITNEDPATHITKITFSAESWEGEGESGAWKPRTGSMEMTAASGGQPAKTFVQLMDTLRPRADDGSTEGDPPTISPAGRNIKDVMVQGTPMTTPDSEIKIPLLSEVEVLVKKNRNLLPTTPVGPEWLPYQETDFQGLRIGTLSRSFSGVTPNADWIAADADQFYIESMPAG